MTDHPLAQTEMGDGVAANGRHFVRFAAADVVGPMAAYRNSRPSPERPLWGSEAAGAYIKNSDPFSGASYSTTYMVQISGALITAVAHLVGEINRIHLIALTSPMPGIRWHGQCLGGVRSRLGPNPLP